MSRNQRDRASQGLRGHVGAPVEHDRLPRTPQDFTQSAKHSRPMNLPALREGLGVKAAASNPRGEPSDNQEASFLLPEIYKGCWAWLTNGRRLGPPRSAEAAAPGVARLYPLSVLCFL